MASLLARVRDAGESSSDEYTRVGEEERKPLNAYREEADNDEQTAAEIYALKRTIKRTNLYLKVLIGLLSVTILALLSLQGPSAYKTIKEVKDKPKEAAKEASKGAPKPKQLIKTPVPDIPMSKVTFEENKLYSERPNPETDAAWDALLPDGRGFVFIDNWKDYDLPPGEETEWGMIYSVAVFHQMHCLGQLRRFSWMFLDAITKNNTEEQAAITEMFEKQNHASHLHHCFDYLRQTIACGGDMAMEWPRTEEDGRRFAVDGWGIPHECKNWDHIMEYMDNHHFNMSMNSQIAPLEGAAEAGFPQSGMKQKLKR
ncbi:hypothetical protein BLS_007965 [Venturia inaequalis]|uniref:Oxidase ustYa n=1 Tax=Venturia inaequalis TaxID=5025 RepID=A0A8H3VTU3_VENIN|nr:hypothetical protein EG328_001230 [Venturia inaequalis]KAE9964962.1 hypothetical protein BLS_007965 [Venturia inaequalis]KAE9993688.1 hypothetical protein EG327_003697 [Venturia inaequalis]